MLGPIKDYYADRQRRGPRTIAALKLLAALVAIGWALFWFAPPWWCR